MAQPSYQTHIIMVPPAPYVVDQAFRHRGPSGYTNYIQAMAGGWEEQDIFCATYSVKTKQN